MRSSSRRGHVAVAIDQEMLLWGGEAMVATTGEKYLCPPHLIECFNLATSEWTQRRAISNMPDFDIPRPCLSARIGVVQNRYIYQFGGGYRLPNGCRVYSNNVHKLDGLTLEWQRIVPSDQTTPIGRRNHGMCVLGGKGDEHLVIVGGYGTTIVSPTPEGSQFVTSPKNLDRGCNNEVWLFSLRESK